MSTELGTANLTRQKQRALSSSSRESVTAKVAALIPGKQWSLYGTASGLEVPLVSGSTLKTRTQAMGLGTDRQRTESDTGAQCLAAQM